MMLRVKVTAGILEQYFGTMSVWKKHRIAHTALLVDTNGR